MEEDCIFCSIGKGKIPCHKIYENKHVIAFLDISLVNKGHTLVIPKHHASRIHEITDSELNNLTNALAKVSKAIEKGLDCDCNILNNSGSKAGQLVHHVHFHIIPRKGSDEEWKLNWKTRSYDKDEETAFIEMIKKEIS